MHKASQRNIYEHGKKGAEGEGTTLNGAQEGGRAFELNFEPCELAIQNEKIFFLFSVCLLLRL